MGPCNIKDPAARCEVCYQGHNENTRRHFVVCSKNHTVCMKCMRRGRTDQLQCPFCENNSRDSDPPKKQELKYIRAQKPKPALPQKTPAPEPEPTPVITISPPKTRNKTPNPPQRSTTTTQNSKQIAKKETTTSSPPLQIEEKPKLEIIQMNKEQISKIEQQKVQLVKNPAKQVIPPQTVTSKPPTLNNFEKSGQIDLTKKYTVPKKTKKNGDYPPPKKVEEYPVSKQVQEHPIEKKVQAYIVPKKPQEYPVQTKAEVYQTQKRTYQQPFPKTTYERPVLRQSYPTQMAQVVQYIEPIPAYKPSKKPITYYPQLQEEPGYYQQPSCCSCCQTLPSDRPSPYFAVIFLQLLLTAANIYYYLSPPSECMDKPFHQKILIIRPWLFAVSIIQLTLILLLLFDILIYKCKCISVKSLLGCQRYLRILWGIKLLAWTGVCLEFYMNNMRQRCGLEVQIFGLAEASLNALLFIILLAKTI